MTAIPDTDDGRLVLRERRGPQPHSTKFGRKHFLKIHRQGTPTTTRQAEILNTAVIGTPTTEEGVVIGRDRISASMVAHDPFTAYEGHRITSPNVCVMGSVGSGKSGLLKTVYVIRPLLLLNRRAVVVDKKIRGGEGEYAETTREFGAEPFRFDPEDPENSTCMNPLDPVILAGGGPAAQRRLLGATAELAGGSPLDEWHHGALTTAYTALLREFEDKRRVPVMPDLLEQFRGVVGSPKYEGVRPATLDLIEQASWSLMQRFERLLDDDLQGMFDRETSKHVVLHPKLTTFDISALPEDGPATSMVMVVANAWLMGMLKYFPGSRTNFIAEEGWDLLSGPGGRLLRAHSKLARARGVSIISALHHLSDIPPGSDALALIKEAQTLHLFRQDRADDIAECVALFNLEESNAHTLATLPQGDHLLMIGTNREIRVQHVRSTRDKQLTGTDAAMLSTPAEEAVDVVH